ncbi:MAG: iron ABC transporter permease [Bdellovibrio sp.]
MSLPSALRGALVLFLLFPFLFLLGQFEISSMPDWAELYWAFKNSFIQSFFSALFSLFLGFWVACGLVSVSRDVAPRGRVSLEVLCLLPNFLPPLFILLSVLNVVDPFPMGLAGIVLIHSLMNFGLVAVILAHAIESKVGGVAEWAYVQGVSRPRFIWQGLLPMIRKDLWHLGLFIFVICFASFAVPLIVGGGRGTTVEVLIYEKIRLTQEWGGAVLLALLQSVFIFALSFIARPRSGAARARHVNLRLLRALSGLGVLAGLSLLYIYGYVQGLLQGLSSFSAFYGLEAAIGMSFAGTLLIGLSSGFLCYAFLMVTAYCWQASWFEKFLGGYVAPSTSLACFSLLIWGPNEGFFPYLKIPLALVLLSLNSLVRMGWASEMHSLQSQVTVAYVMGASRGQIFRELLFPQLAGRAGVLAGIAAVWACGDFAISRILAHRDLSIGMMTETLMSGYRLNQAILLSGLIVLAGLICFGICVGGSRVLRRKFAP